MNRRLCAIGLAAVIGVSASQALTATAASAAAEPPPIAHLLSAANVAGTDLTVNLLLAQFYALPAVTEAFAPPADGAPADLSAKLEALTSVPEVKEILDQLLENPEVQTKLTYVLPPVFTAPPAEVPTTEEAVTEPEAPAEPAAPTESEVPAEPAV